MVGNNELEYVVDKLEQFLLDVEEGFTSTDSITCNLNPDILCRLLDSCHEIHDKTVRNLLETVIKEAE